jgi:predicted deacylase
MLSPKVIYDDSQIDFDLPGKHHYQIAFHQDSSWDYSLVPLTVINGLKKPREDCPGVVAFGGTHGNEWEGQVSVKRLCHDLDPAQMSGRVLLIPQLSESACVANQRTSPLDGANMNRVFPGNPRGTISSRIAHFVKTRIFPQVRVVLDIHAAGYDCRLAICTSFHPIEDPAQRQEMAKVAALFDTPFIFIYSTSNASGLLPGEAEKEGKIAIGGEFGYAESASVQGTSHAYEGIKNVLRHYGILPGEIVKVDPRRPSPPRIVESANLEDYVPSPKAGIWEPVVELGSEVRKGDLLGRLHDFSDHSIPATEIRAHRSGVVLMMQFRATTSKGAVLYIIARDADPL